MKGPRSAYLIFCLSKKDPELYKAINDELIRQQQHIELIASENIVSQAVLEAQGSVLTNKYADCLLYTSDAADE